MTFNHSRLATAVLALAVTASLVGCGGGQSASSTTEATPTSSTGTGTGTGTSTTPVSSTSPAPAASAADLFVRQVPGAEVSATPDGPDAAVTSTTAGVSTKAYLVKVDTTRGVQSVSMIRSSTKDADTVTEATKGTDGKYRVVLPTASGQDEMSFVRVTTDDGNAVEINAESFR